MIADLKADSARWEAERRQTASRGQPSGGEYSRDAKDIRNSNTPLVEYRSSTTHQSRQYYGPTDAASTGYGTPQPQVQSQAPAYGDRYGQPNIGGYSQAYTPDDHYYIQGGDSRPAPGEVRPQPAIPSQPGTVYAQPRYVQQPAQPYADSRATPYYAQAAPGNVTPQQQQYPTQQQPSDPFYGRGAYIHRHTTLLYYPVLRMNGL